MSEKQATPEAELFRRLSSPSEPKTELEHFAWRLYWDCAEDNTRLRQRVAELEAANDAKAITIERLAEQVVERGERMKAMYRWMRQEPLIGIITAWTAFCSDYAGDVDWFKGGEPL